MDLPKINIKFLAWFSIIFLVVSLYFNFSQHFRNKELQNYKDDSLEELKAEKDSIIKAKLMNIEYLVQQNELNDMIIIDANNRYDSLKLVKDSVQIVYKVKYKEIMVYSTNEVENYWKDEFK